MSAVDEQLVDRTVQQTYWELRLRADGIVCLTRSGQSYPSIDAVHESYDDFLRVVDDWLLERRIKAGQVGTKARTPMAWLTDMRGAPDLRNDPEFEAVVRARRPDLLERSPALGILVKTAAGRMQLGRITRDKEAMVGVFSDPAEIVAWLGKRMRECYG